MTKSLNIRDLPPDFFVDTPSVEKQVSGQKTMNVSDFPSDFFVSEDPNVSVYLEGSNEIVEMPESMLGRIATIASGGYKKGDAAAEINSIYFRKLLGDKNPELDSKLAELQKDANLQIMTDGLIESAVRATAEQTPQLIEMAKKALAGGVAGAGAGAAIGAGIGAVGGSVIPGAGTAAAAAGGASVGGSRGFILGANGGIALNSFIQNAGGSFAEYVNLIDKEGSGLKNEDDARLTAYMVGAGAAGLDIIPVNKFVRLFPGGNAVLNKVAQLGGKTIKLPKGKSAIARFAKDLISATATEVVTENAQEGLQILGGEVVKNISDQDYAPVTQAEIWNRLGDTTKETLLSVVPLAGATAGVRAGIEKTSEIRAKKSTEATKQLEEKITEISKEESSQTAPQENKQVSLSEFTKDEQQTLQDAGLVDKENNVSIPTSEQSLAGVLAKIQESRRDTATQGTVQQTQDNIDTTVIEARLKKLDDNISAIDKQIDAATQLYETKQSNNQATARTEQKIENLLKKRDLFDEERANILATESPRINEQVRVGDQTANIQVKSAALQSAQDSNVTLRGVKIQNIGQQAIRDINKSFREGRALAKKDVTEAQNFVTTVIDQSALTPADKAKFIRTIKNIKDAEGLTKKLPEIQSRISNLVEAASRRQLKSDIKAALSKTKTKKQSGKPVGKFDAETQVILDRLRSASKMSVDAARTKLESIEQKTMEDSINGKFPSYEEALENSILSSIADKDNLSISDLEKLKEDINGLIAGGKEARRNELMAKATEVAEIQDGINELVTGKPVSLIDTRGMGKFYHGTSQEILELNEAYYSPDNIYGNGFYSTDAVDIASFYKKRKKDAVNPIIYSVKQKSDVKFFDLDSKIDLQSNELSAFKKNLESDSQYNDSAEYALSELLDGNVKTYTELLDESRRGSVKDEFQDLVTNIQEDLKKQGYGGFEHAGGKIVGKKEHRVRIYWEPENQIKLDIVSERSLYKTPDLQLKDKTFAKSIIEALSDVNNSFMNYDWNDILDIILPPSKTNPDLKASIIKKMSITKLVQKEKGIVRTWSEEFNNEAKAAFGLTKDADLVEKFYQDSRERIIGNFKNSAGREVRLKYSKQQARKFYMEYQDESLQEFILSDKGMAYTPEMVGSIINQLDRKDIIFARKQLELYRKFYPQVQEVYSRIHGTYLPDRDNYSPTAREVDKDFDITRNEFMEEVAFRASIESRSFVSRVKNFNALKKQSDVAVFQRHTAEMAHFISMGERLQQIQQVFGDKNLRDNLKAAYGDGMVELIDETIDSFAKNGAIKSNSLDRVINGLNRSFALSKLGGKAALAPKQLTSMLAYWEDMSVKDFVGGLIDFAKNPKAAIQTLNQSELVKARGIPEVDLARLGKTTEAQEKLGQLFRKTKKIQDLLLLPTKFGDKGAILVGGWSFYKNQIKQGKSPQQALEAFEEITARTQQSTDIDRLGRFQRGNAFVRGLSMFLTSPNAFLKQEVKAIRKFKRGEITGKELGKKVFLYHFALPAVFQFVANGFNFDEEDQLAAVATGPLTGYFFLGEVVSNAIRSLVTDDNFRISPLKTLMGFEEVFKGIADGAENFGDTEEMLDAAVEIMAGVGTLTGLPVDQIKNTAEGIEDINYGQPVRGTERILGYSKKSVEEIDN